MQQLPRKLHPAAKDLHLLRQLVVAKISLKSSPLMRLAAARVSSGQAARHMQELAAASIQESGPEHVSQRALHALRILCLLGKEMMVNREPYIFYT